jgi:hypothetical protein
MKERVATVHMEPHRQQKDKAGGLNVLCSNRLASAGSKPGLLHTSPAVQVKWSLKELRVFITQAAIMWYCWAEIVILRVAIYEASSFFFQRLPQERSGLKVALSESSLKNLALTLLPLIFGTAFKIDSDSALKYSQVKYSQATCN